MNSNASLLEVDLNILDEALDLSVPIVEQDEPMLIIWR